MRQRTCRKMIWAAGAALDPLPSGISVAKTAAPLMIAVAREGGNLIAVRQDFGESFSGRALLIFPHSDSLLLYAGGCSMTTSLIR